MEAAQQQVEGVNLQQLSLSRQHSLQRQAGEYSVHQGPPPVTRTGAAQQYADNRQDFASQMYSTARPSGQVQHGPSYPPPQPRLPLQQQHPNVQTHGQHEADGPFFHPQKPAPLAQARQQPPSMPLDQGPAGQAMQADRQYGVGQHPGYSYQGSTGNHSTATHYSGVHDGLRPAPEPSSGYGYEAQNRRSSHDHPSHHLSGYDDSPSRSQQYYDVSPPPRTQHTSYSTPSSQSSHHHYSSHSQAPDPPPPPPQHGQYSSQLPPLHHQYTTQPPPPWPSRAREDERSSQHTAAAFRTGSSEFRDRELPSYSTQYDHPQPSMRLTHSRNSARLSDTGEEVNHGGGGGSVDGRHYAGSSSGVPLSDPLGGSESVGQVLEFINKNKLAKQRAVYEPPSGMHGSSGLGGFRSSAVARSAAALDAKWVQPSGPRRPGEGTENEEQGLVGAESSPGGVTLRITLLASGFIIGPSGSSIREVMRVTGVDIKSWTEQANSRSRRPCRVFTLEGEEPALLDALTIVTAAVDRYKELCEGRYQGKCVPRQQRVHNVDFVYQPPPRNIVPCAAALKGQPANFSTRGPRIGYEPGSPPSGYGLPPLASSSNGAYSPPTNYSSSHVHEGPPHTMYPHLPPSPRQPDPYGYGLPPGPPQYDRYAPRFDDPYRGAFNPAYGSSSGYGSGGGAAPGGNSYRGSPRAAPDRRASNDFQRSSDSVSPLMTSGQGMYGSSAGGRDPFVSGGGGPSGGPAYQQLRPAPLQLSHMQAPPVPAPQLPSPLQSMGGYYGLQQPLQMAAPVPGMGLMEPVMGPMGMPPSPHAVMPMTPPSPGMPMDAASMSALHEYLVKTGGYSNPIPGAGMVPDVGQGYAHLDMAAFMAGFVAAQPMPGPGGFGGLNMFFPPPLTAVPPPQPPMGGPQSPGRGGFQPLSPSKLNPLAAPWDVPIGHHPDDPSAHQPAAHPASGSFPPEATHTMTDTSAPGTADGKVTPGQSVGPTPHDSPRNNGGSGGVGGPLGFHQQGPTGVPVTTKPLSPNDVPHVGAITLANKTPRRATKPPSGTVDFAGGRMLPIPQAVPLEGIASSVGGNNAPGTAPTAAPLTATALLDSTGAPGTGSSARASYPGSILEGPVGGGLDVSVSSGETALGPMVSSGDPLVSPSRFSAKKVLRRPRHSDTSGGMGSPPFDRNYPPAHPQQPGGPLGNMPAVFSTLALDHGSPVGPDGRVSDLINTMGGAGNFNKPGGGGIGSVTSSGGSNRSHGLGNTTVPVSGTTTPTRNQAEETLGRRLSQDLAVLANQQQQQQQDAHPQKSLQVPVAAAPRPPLPPSAQRFASGQQSQSPQQLSVAVPTAAAVPAGALSPGRGYGDGAYDELAEAAREGLNLRRSQSMGLPPSAMEGDDEGVVVG